MKPALHIGSGLFLALGWLTPASAQELAVTLTCGAPPVSVEVPDSRTVTLRVDGSESSWVSVEERGHLLAVAGPQAAPASVVGMPFRFGKHRASLQRGGTVQVTRASTSSGAVKAIVHADCDLSEAGRGELRWFERAADISSRMQRMLTPEEATALEADLGALDGAATSAKTRALLTHMRAQVLLLAGRSSDAAEAFAVAERAWADAGDVERARVAKVARVEELLRLARHAEVPGLVSGVPAPDDDYFSARLGLAGCLAARYLGQLDDALTCYERGVARMEALGETLDLVSALQDMADVSRFQGDAERAKEVGSRAMAAASLPGMEVHRGRIALMLAGIAEEQGDIAEALAQLDKALVEFSAGKASRWEANALLVSADLYLELGALEESSDLVGAALRRLNRRDAPARVAAAHVMQARIDMARGYMDAAARMLGDAASVYAELRMPAELDTVQALQAQWMLRQGHPSQARELLDRRDISQALNRTEWELLKAEVARESGDCSAATRTVKPMLGTELSLSGELRVYRVLARCRAATGDKVGARAMLMEAAEGLASVIRSARSPLLREMLASHIGPLRDVAFEVDATTAHESPMSPAEAWVWLQLEGLSQTEAARGDRSTSADTFDAQVAAELLGTSAAPARPTSTSLALLRQLSEGSSDNAQSNAVLTLQDFQRRLPDSTVFLSATRMGRDSAVLWVTSERAGLVRVTGHEDWLERSRAMTASLAHRGSSMMDLAEQATKLSTQLLGAVPAARPDNLWVDARSSLASVPWVTVPWPGSDTPLVESTRVTLARVEASVPHPLDGRADITTFTGGAEATGHLPALTNAGNEAALIAAAVSAQGGTVTPRLANDRKALIQAFATRRPWLHLAAHGAAQTTRLGYAGIWLDDPAAKAPPTFLSWLEILSRGAVTELVVLNACQLADSSSQWLTFADAVSRAGAAHVVAARWQVSDGAASVWVPAFYEHVSGGSDVGDAMREAQLRLRASRAFRHPFFWASFVHIAKV